MDRLTTWRDRTRITYVVLAALLAVVGWRLAARQDGGGTAAGDEPRPVVAVRTAPIVAPPPITVHVVGAVRHPGVYRLPGGARLQDAVRRAGGPGRRAGLSALNLAAPATDGQQVVVPLRGAGGAHGGGGPPPGGTAPGASAGPVSLSRATAEELEALDGIGPTLAQRIVDWRERNGPFGSVDDLLDVPGIGETRLEALRASVVP